MKRIVFGLLILIACSCGGKTAKFSLSGKTSGIEDGAILYLDYKNSALDSATIENERFRFHTVIPKSPVQVVLRTKDFSHYRFLWLENKTMTFDATQTDFKNAKVTGSESEDLNQSLNSKIDTLHGNERLKFEMEFVRDNPNSIVSAHILSVYSTTLGKEKTNELFGQFSNENKQSEFGEKIAKYLELNQNPGIGDHFVDFKMTAPNGDIKRLSDLKGKIILLEFWASWCGPCRQQNPDLVNTYEKFKPKGFEIFAVSLDDNKVDWLNAIKQDHLPWMNVSDLNGDENEAGLIYGINGIPDNFLIDRNSIIIGRNLRGEELDIKLNEILE